MSVPGDFFNRGTFIPDRLVSYITAELGGDNLITPTTERGGDMTWRYHKDLGIYKPDGISFIEKQAEEALGKKVRSGYIGETVALCKIRTYTDPEEFVEDPNLIVLKKGVYHIDTGEITKHSPLHYAKSAMPINYDPDARCPEILKFLGQVIPDTVETFQEWIGYHLYKDMIYHKAAMFIGDGANGKTTLQDLMNAFLGTDNISQVGLYHLISNRFAASDLYGKLANISPEISSDELKRTGIFKALTGHDRIRAEKKYRDAFSFLNHAKLTFLCNTLPKTLDQTAAFFRRWLIFVFPNKFEGDSCDPKILEKLTTPEELSGLLNWALEGLTRLMKNDRFTKSMSSDELQLMYEAMSDPITGFIEQHLTMSTSGAELKDDVYRAYFEFCRSNQYVAVTSRTFTSELKPRIAGLAESTRKIRGKRGRCWVGIKLTGVTQGTLDTRLTVSSGGKITQREISGSVSNVLCVTLNKEPAPDHHNGDISRLFQDAREFLEVNDGTMEQPAFFLALIGLGYHRVQASKVLRADPRLRFMGDTVSLVG